MKNINSTPEERQAFLLNELMISAVQIKEQLKLMLDIVDEINPDLVKHAKDNWAGHIWNAIDETCKFSPHNETIFNTINFYEMFLESKGWDKENYNKLIESYREKNTSK